MIGEFSALGAAIAWAGGSTIIKPVAERLKPLPLNVIRNSTAWLFLTLALLPFGKLGEVKGIPSESFLYIALSGVIGLVIGTTIYIKALGMASISRVYTISTGSWILWSCLLAVLFLGEGFKIYTGMGAALILLGIALLSESPEGRKKGERAGIILAFTTGICWGVGIAFLKLGLEGADPLIVNVIRLPFVFLLLFLLSLRGGGFRAYGEFKRGDLLRAGGGGVLDQVVASVLYFFAIKLSGAAKATILASSSPLFIVPLALLLGERITPRIIAGTLVCTVGIWLTII